MYLLTLMAGLFGLKAVRLRIGGANVKGCGRQSVAWWQETEKIEGEYEDL